VRQPLEIAEDDGNAVLLGQMVHLLMQDRLPVAQFDAVRQRRRSHVGHLSFVGSPPRSGELDGPGDVEGDAVQPGGQGLLLADRAGLARQDEERRLERILGIRVLAQHPPANGEDERAMALQERGEGILAPLANKLLQQDGVTLVADLVRTRGVAEKSQNGRYLARHSPS